MAEKEAEYLQGIQNKDSPSCPLASNGLDLSWVFLRPSDGLMFAILPCLWSNFGAVVQA